MQGHYVPPLQEILLLRVLQFFLKKVKVFKLFFSQVLKALYFCYWTWARYQHIHPASSLNPLLFRIIFQAVMSRQYFRHIVIQAKKITIGVSQFRFLAILESVAYIGGAFVHAPLVSTVAIKVYVCYLAIQRQNAIFLA